MIPEHAYLARKRTSVFSKVEIKLDIALPKHAKSDSEITELKGLMSKNFLINGLSSDLFDKIVDAVEI